MYISYASHRTTSINPKKCPPQRNFIKRISARLIFDYSSENLSSTINKPALSGENKSSSAHYIAPRVHLLVVSQSQLLQLLTQQHVLLLDLAKSTMILCLLVRMESRNRPMRRCLQRRLAPTCSIPYDLNSAMGELASSGLDK